MAESALMVPVRGPSSVPSSLAHTMLPQEDKCGVTVKVCGRGDSGHCPCLAGHAGGSLGAVRPAAGAARAWASLPGRVWVWDSLAHLPQMVRSPDDPGVLHLSVLPGVPGQELCAPGLAPGSGLLGGSSLGPGSGLREGGWGSLLLPAPTGHFPLVSGRWTATRSS